MLCQRFDDLWRRQMIVTDSVGHLVRAVEANQGTVLTSKFVTGLIIEGGQCAGVKTAGGETFRAKYGVVSSMHTNQIVKMVPQELGPVYVESAKMLKPLFAEMLFCVHFALNEAPRWKVGEQRITCPAVQLVGTLDDRIRQANASLEGRLYDGPSFLQVFNPTVIDPSRAPPGKHVMKFEVLAPYAWQGGAAHWDDIKRDYADRLLVQVRKYAENLDDNNIIARRIMTPLDIEGRNINNVGGSQGGAITAALFMRRFVAAQSWVHFDLFAWSPSAKPGRPEGGECQVARALYALLAARYG